MSIEVLKQLQKELKLICQQIDAFNKLAFSKPEALGEAENICNKLFHSDTYSKAFDEWKSKVEHALATEKKRRRDNFGRIFTKFITDEQAKGTPMKQLDRSWRVGYVEIAINSDSSQIKFLYNKETLTNWKSVADENDISKLYNTALKMLREAIIPLEVLDEVFWNAYEYLRWKQNKNSLTKNKAVPLKSFYHEAKLALQRGAAKRSYKPPKEFPLWAFLYNLDIYLSKSKDIKQELRLAVQTGSQADSSRIGMTTNGLNPQSDYKTHCYILAVDSE